MKLFSNQFTILLIVAVFAGMNFSWNSLQVKIDEKEAAGFMHRSGDLPNLYNDWFAASGTCVQCHGTDTAMIANVDGEGMDINVVDDWKGTIMANAAKDPFWKAKVSHEVLVNPSHQVALESKCTQCHAPMGNYNNVLNGGIDYSMADLAADTVALDGVSCLACHQQTAFELGDNFSGTLDYDTNFKAFGPYTSPLVSPMAIATGYIPEYSEHISDAGICAGCHTLLTQTVDLSGNFTGDEFVEQATYHEWLNSSYNIGQVLEQTCQGCHMPSISDPVFIANGISTEPRTPFSKHELVGANHFMLQIMKNNIDTLGLTCDEGAFDNASDKTLAMLASSLNTQLELIDRSVDTAYFELEITNLAGHKFPSGYPSRRAYVEFVLLDDLQDTIFKSGIIGNDGYIENYNSSYEQHYNTITSEEQVQVYEMVMADVNDQVTTILERAKYPLKDNRLPPKGFTDLHFAYDTCAIFGQALNDINFNQDPVQGSGSDMLYYSIPISEYIGVLEAHVSLKYQAIPRKWLDEMFTLSSEEIDLFQYLFNEANQDPITVSSQELITDPLSIVDDHLTDIRVYPTILDDGRIFIENPSLVPNLRISIYNLSGKIVLDERLLINTFNIVQFEAKKGLYLVVLNSDGHQQVFHAVQIE